MISVDIADTIKDLEAKLKTQSRAVNKALIVGAMQMSDYIKRSITQKRSRGRTYTRRGVRHVASLAGYPPNGDTGFLAFSTQPTRRVKNGVTHVVVGASYAKALEFGTRRMRRRPFVTPARQALAFKIRQRILKAMDAS